MNNLQQNQQPEQKDMFATPEAVEEKNKQRIGSMRFSVHERMAETMGRKGN